MLFRVVGLSSIMLFLSGCVDFGYYIQASKGHIELLSKRQPIDTLVSSGSISPDVKEKLDLVQKITAFSEQEMSLPAGNSYSDYVALDRPFVVWNVFASRSDSFESRLWCYPLVGCVSYRGYFDLASADRYADELSELGLDVFVGGVSAYSTLGWFDDPVLSTFLKRQDFQLAALIFHELSHRVLYIKGDTTFNESFATAVEQIGLEKWVAAQGRPNLLLKYRKSKQLNSEFVAFVLKWKATLEREYQEIDLNNDFSTKKVQLYDQMLEDYERFKLRIAYNGYDHWMEDDLNNAKINTVATYESQVPAFIALYKRVDSDMERFLAECIRLSKQPKGTRDEYLDSLLN